MALSQFIILGYFSKGLNLTIHVEFFHNLSQFKFYGEGELTLREHMFQVIHFFLSNGILCKDFMVIFLMLTFEGRVKRWYHTLLASSLQ